MNKILFFLGLKIKPLEGIFTPSSSAVLNYVKRPELEKKIDKALKIRGTQLIVYGHSGSGKTTLVRQSLYRNKRNFIKTSCISTTTLEELIVNAFDKLDPFYTSKKSSTFSNTVTSSLESNYSTIKSSLASEYTQESSTEFQRVLPIQLTYEKLAEFLGAANCVWLIDDFHKVDDIEKKKLAEVMKAFVDISNDHPQVKIIAIGAVNSPREVVNYNTELRPRLSESFIPLLNEEELKSILVNGAELLNIKFSDKLIKQTIEYSNSLGSICHILAFNHCDLSNITKTSRNTIEIPDSVMVNSIEDYIKDKADTYQEKLDSALKQRTRKYENVKLILTAIIKVGKESVNHNEILSKIQETTEEYPQGNCTTYLTKLCSSEGHEILRFDNNGGTYSFTDPFFKAYCKMALQKIEQEPEIQLSGEIIRDLIKNIRIEIVHTNAG